MQYSSARRRSRVAVQRSRPFVRACRSFWKSRSVSPWTMRCRCSVLANRDVINAVGYMNYRRSVDAARLIATAEGVLGVSAYWVSGTNRVEWREHEKLSGGGINDEAAHVVDLIRYLVGEVVAVQAWRRHTRVDGDVSGSVA